jgi:hypothetical protein
VRSRIPFPSEIISLPKLLTNYGLCPRREKVPGEREGPRSSSAMGFCIRKEKKGVDGYDFEWNQIKPHTHEIFSRLFEIKKKENNSRDEFRFLLASSTTPSKSKRRREKKILSKKERKT